jgi:hypothetical protein
MAEGNGILRVSGTPDNYHDMNFLDWLLPTRRAEAAVRQYRAERLAELRNPRWDEVEQALGRPVPAVLRELYADAQLMEQFDFTFRAPDWPEEEVMLLNAWEPASKASCHPELATIPPGAFSFASNDFGDPFYVTPGSLPDGDGPVFIRQHDGNETEQVAPSLREFISWLPRGS